MQVGLLYRSKLACVVVLQGRTPLLVAVRNNACGALNALLSQSADIDLPDSRVSLPIGSIGINRLNRHCLDHTMLI